MVITTKMRKTVFFLLLIASFVVIFLLNLFTPMFRDDYWYAFSFATGERIESIADVIPSLIAHASVLNGRYVPHFLVQCFTMFPNWVFDLCNTAVFLLLILGCYRLARGEKIYHCGLLVLIIAGLFLLPPDFSQSRLWLSGSCNYLWRDALMVWLFVPYIDAVFSKKTSLVRPLQCLIVLGGLLLGNMSENVSAAAGFWMGLCVLWCFIKRVKTPLWMILTPIATLFGWLALMLAPAGMTSVSQNVQTIGSLLLQFGQSMKMFLENGLLLSILFFALLGLGFYFEVSHDAIAIASMFYLCAVLSSMAMLASNYYPTRAFVGTTVFLLLGCLVLLCPMLARLRPFVNAGACFAGVWVAITMLWALPYCYDIYALEKARNAEVIAMREDGITDVVTFGIAGHTRYDVYTGEGMIDLAFDANMDPNPYFAKYFEIDSIAIDREE